MTSLSFDIHLSYKASHDRNYEIKKALELDTDCLMSFLSMLKLSYCLLHTYNIRRLSTLD